MPDFCQLCTCHYWTGEQKEQKQQQDDAIEDELRCARSEGPIKTKRTATGMVMKTRMPAVVRDRFEQDLGAGALRDPDTLRTLRRLHPEFFPKEVAGGTGRVFAARSRAS